MPTTRCSNGPPQRSAAAPGARAAPHTAKSAHHNDADSTLAALSRFSAALCCHCPAVRIVQGAERALLDAHGDAAHWTKRAICEAAVESITAHADEADADNAAQWQLQTEDPSSATGAFQQPLQLLPVSPFSTSGEQPASESQHPWQQQQQQPPYASSAIPTAISASDTATLVDSTIARPYPMPPAIPPPPWAAHLTAWTAQTHSIPVFLAVASAAAAAPASPSFSQPAPNFEVSQMHEQAIGASHSSSAAPLSRNHLSSGAPQTDDHEPLFRFAQPLLPGLSSADGFSSLRRIESDTSDFQLLQCRLLMSNLSPLSTAASPAEVLVDLQSILLQLRERQMLQDGEVEWAARVAPQPGATNTSVVLQLRSGVKATNALISAMQERRAGLAWTLRSWLKAELTRLNMTWAAPPNQRVCFWHFSELGVLSCCTGGPRCLDSHRLADLRLLQRLDRENAREQAASSSATAAAADASSGFFAAPAMSPDARAEPTQPSVSNHLSEESAPLSATIGDEGVQFHFRMPLRPGLIITHGAGQPSEPRLEIIHSDTSDQKIIPRILLLSGLPAPLPNPLQDLQSLLTELSTRGVLSSNDVEWIARPQGPSGEHSAVLRLQPQVRVVEILTRAQSHLTLQPGWQLRPWVEREIIRFSHQWAHKPSETVCKNAFVVQGSGARRCNFYPNCRHSHSIGNLYTLQQRAIDAASGPQPHRHCSNAERQSVRSSDGGWTAHGATAASSRDMRNGRARGRSRSRSRSRDRHRDRRRRSSSPRRLSPSPHAASRRGSGHSPASANSRILDVEADGEPLFHFTLPLLPGLTFSGHASSLQRIESDTVDQSLIQSRLLLSGLPPLRADASDAELRADLDGVLKRLKAKDLVRPGDLRWMARVAPAAGDTVSTSLVIQLDPALRLMTAKLSGFRQRWDDKSQQLEPWVYTEIMRHDSHCKPGDVLLCFNHYERFGNRTQPDGQSRCRYGDRCRFSHKLEDLRRLQQRDRDGRLADTAATPNSNSSHSADAGAAQPAQPPESDGPFEFTLSLQPALCLNVSQSAGLTWAQLRPVDGRTRDQSVLRRRFVWSGLGLGPGSAAPLPPQSDDTAIHADLVHALEWLSASGVLTAADVEWLARVAEPQPSASPPRLILQLRESASALSLARRLPGTSLGQGHDQLRPWLAAELEELNTGSQSYARVCEHWFAGLNGNERSCSQAGSCRYSHSDADLQRLIDRRARIQTLERQMAEELEEAAHKGSHTQSIREPQNSCQ